MSSDTLDPNLIEQTKHQIRTLVNEIAQLSRTDVTPQEFYGEFLTRVVSALAANGGAVWATEDQGGGPLSLQYQINIQETNLREASEEDQQRHGRLIHKVMGTGEGLLVPPRSGAGDDGEAGNPTDFLLVMAALKTDLQVLGVVEVFQRAEAGPQTQKGYLRFLLQMCELAGDFLKSRQLRSYSDRQALWTQLEEFTRSVHASLDPRTTAYCIANEGRRLIECDRVSIGIRKGRRCVIEAVSGQDMFDKRSNTVRLLGDLASAVVASGEPVWYTGDTSNMAPQVEDAVQAYVDESHSKTVAVIPLRRPEATEEKEPDEPREPDEPVGALIVEQIEDARVAPKMVQRVDVVAQHSSVALANAMEHQGLFLMPLWRAIGKSMWIVQARTLPKTISIGVAVLVALLCLVLVPGNFKLHCKGTLEAVERRDVWAGVDGDVEEVLVKHGDKVVPGQLLARLRNTELEVQIKQTDGELQSCRADLGTAQREIFGGKRLTSTERDQLHGRRYQLQEKASSLEQQLELYKVKKRGLEVRSPTAGVVVTWDLYNRLIHRPVQRGQSLMRVANPEKDWQLELQMPEDRMGYLANRQQETGDQELYVRYVLATDPGTEREGWIKEVGRSAEVHGEEGSTVPVKVTIDRNVLKEEHVRPGATVSAQVYCGRRPIGFVWFHDLVAFVQSKVLFRFF
jgi:multidrug efflux pump subunit AcrA (membrane-fusion protein)